MKEKILKYSTAVYEVFEEAFFGLGFVLGFLLLFSVSVFLGAYFQQTESNYLGFFICFALTIVMLGMLTIWRNLFNTVYRFYFDKSNRKILKNIIGIFLIIQVFVLSGQEIGKSISNSLGSEILDVSFVFTILNRLLEGLLG